jgi:hypothetical protein
VVFQTIILPINPATGWRTMIRSNFGKYILINNLADIEHLINEKQTKTKIPHC